MFEIYWLSKYTTWNHQAAIKMGYADKYIIVCIAIHRPKHTHYTDNYLLI